MGAHAPQPARARRDRRRGRLRGPRPARRARGPHPRGPADRGEALRAGDPGHPRPGPRPGPPPRRAGRAGGRRPPGDGAPRRREDPGRVPAVARRGGRGHRDRTGRAPPARGPHRPLHRPRPAPQHRAPAADRPRRRRGGGPARRRRRHRRLRGRDAGPGLPRPRVGTRGPGRGRRRGPLHRHPVAARRPAPDRPRPRAAGGQGPHDAVRRGRRLRRPRGPVDADPRLSAGAAHRQTGEDGLQPLRVLLRPRPPPPGEAPLRARRHP